MTPFDVNTKTADSADAGGAVAPGAAYRTPARREAEAAVRTLLAYIGEDPRREGLADTPARVVKSYLEYFGGYSEDAAEVLARTFEETDGYDEMIVLRDVDFVSHCEHHMVPIIGTAHVGYLPARRVVGISKLARIVDIFARRLQIQERLTAQIANTVYNALQPHGVAVVLESEHQCMTTRGIQKRGTRMITSRMLGRFRDDSATRREFEGMIGR